MDLIYKKRMKMNMSATLLSFGKKLSRNHKGEIVTLTMIMMGLGMIVMAAVFSGILNVYKMKKSDSLSMQQKDIIKQIDNLLTLPTVCASLFSGQNINSSILNPNNKAYSTSLSAGASVLLNGQMITLNSGAEVAPGLILDGMKYYQKSNSATMVDIGGTMRNGQDGALIISFSKKNSEVLFKTYQDVEFNIQMATDGAGDIFSCASLSEEGKACEALNGVWRPLAPLGLRCQIKNTCLNGGSFVNAPENEGGFGNPLASGLKQCPAGYDEKVKGNVAYPYHTGKYDVKNRIYQVKECVLCIDSTGIRQTPASPSSLSNYDADFSDVESAAQRWLNQNGGFFGIPPL